ncbi:MAG TPA: hypothetical protein VJT31_20895 [Rugosimonospora sp.]|nr:hypothetical protein [Rugosimonospora sp.]
MPTVLISNHVAIVGGLREHHITATRHPTLDLAVASGDPTTTTRIILDVNSLRLWSQRPPQVRGALVLAVAGALPADLEQLAATVGVEQVVDVSAGHHTRWYRLPALFWAEHTNVLGDWRPHSGTQLDAATVGMLTDSDRQALRCRAGCAGSYLTEPDEE